MTTAALEQDDSHLQCNKSTHIVSFQLVTGSLMNTNAAATEAALISFATLALLRLQTGKVTATPMC